MDEKTERIIIDSINDMRFELARLQGYLPSEHLAVGSTCHQIVLLLNELEARYITDRSEDQQ